MKNFILIISFTLAAAGVCHASDDPMVSVFKFQKTMALAGNAAAMMKLGEMYEQGLGTKQDLSKALQMYRKANARGFAGADTAILRVMRTQRAQAIAAKRNKDHASEVKKYKQELQRAEAQRKALEKRQVELERQARQKARRAALIRHRAEQQARRDARARARAQAQLAAERARAAAEAKQQAREKAKLKQAEEQAKKQELSAKKKSARNKHESFKSDPCQGPAARVMSTCK